MRSGERRNSPRIKVLAGWSCTTTMHLVEINARPIEGETDARDCDFSRAAVQTRWQVGYAETCRMLERRPWEVPIGPAVEYESDAPANSHSLRYHSKILFQLTPCNRRPDRALLPFTDDSIPIPHQDTTGRSRQTAQFRELSTSSRSSSLVL